MKKGQYVSGYMTVEAALVMTVVMLVYLFIIRCMFFQYDRCILEQETARLAVRYAGVSRESLEEAKQLADARWDGEQFLLLAPASPDLELQNGYVTVNTSDDTGLFQGIQYKIRQMKPEKLLRIQRRILIEQKQEEGKD